MVGKDGWKGWLERMMVNRFRLSQILYQSPSCPSTSLLT